MSDSRRIDRRRFCGAAAAGVAGSLGILGASRRLEAMTDVLTEMPSSERVGANDVRPFRVSVPDQDLAELRRRVKATKWPEPEQVPDASQGVQLTTMVALANYWARDYDWRKCEARLNSFPQFVTNIEGLDIHFLHVRSKHPNALPLIITHGWPGSVIEQLKIIQPLTDPTAHGGTVADAFHLVIPSLPGHGFSAKPSATGWDPPRIARAWTTLMQRLGYKRFVAQGGDWGNAVSEQMGLQAPPELLAISTNMPATVPVEIARALAANQSAPANLTGDERHAWDMLDFFYEKGRAYSIEMALRPQTLYGLVDSPIGLAGWMLDHDAASQAMIARVFNGQSEGLSRDDVLDNITLYWVTNTAVSSARLYWNNLQSATKGLLEVKDVGIPVAVSVFPTEIYAAPRSWAVRAYPKLIHFNTLPKGGHFAAWEQPAYFVDEMRASFKSIRW